VAAVVMALAAAMKTLAATAMAGVTDNNQPKLAAEEMAAVKAMATVTARKTARTMMAAMTMAVPAAFLPDRQQSTKRSWLRSHKHHKSTESMVSGGHPKRELVPPGRQQ
jgi:hypothetical protein